MRKKTKPEKMPVPSIKITLTTFTDDENGQLAEAKNGMVKIDGEEESSKGVFFDFPIFKSVVVRNLFILSFGQFLLFMSFNCISNLQIVMNGKDNLGPISLAVVYGGLTISLFFLPTAVIKNFGCKKTLVIATACFCPFILANYHPTWASLIITAFLCGLTSGPLWIARSTYLNHISHRYAKLQKFAVGLINAWFFSVCTTFHQSTEIWGGLLSYYTLKFSHENESQFSNDDPEQCGPDLCYDGSYSINYDFSLPSEERWYILVTVLTALVLLATVFIAFFLDSLELEESSEIQKLKFSSTDLFATLYQFFDLDQMLLLPLSLYTGMVDGFYSGDYTKAYIGCAWGIPHVLVVSLCFGVVSSLVDAACGPCVHVLGRGSLFVLAALAHLAMFLALLIWRPNSERIAGYFLVASAHGIGNGVWMSQLVALYGVLFRKNEEAAFSCHYFLNSLGYLLAYSYSSYFCTKTKIYIPMVILIVGLISYLAVEVRMVQRSLVEYRLRRPQEEID